MDVIQEIRERLSIFQNMYNQIRVVDPINREVVLFNGEKEELTREKCNVAWETDLYCENCISMKAYTEMDSIFKIDHKNDKIVLITATPTIINGKTYVVELIKGLDILSMDGNESLLEIHKDMINDINQEFIKEESINKKCTV